MWYAFVCCLNSKIHSSSVIIVSFSLIYSNNNNNDNNNNDTEQAFIFCSFQRPIRQRYRPHINRKWFTIVFALVSNGYPYYLSLFTKILTCFCVVGEQLQIGNDFMYLLAIVLWHHQNASNERRKFSLFKAFIFYDAIECKYQISRWKSPRRI